MEQVGAALMDGIDYETTQYSGCEDKGQVDPYVLLGVPEWSIASVANRWLAEHGWTLVKNGSGGLGTRYRSADGEWVATVAVWTSVKTKRVEILLLSAAQFAEDNGHQA